jgi:gluconolactonase
VIAFVEGSPNGLAFGPDGALYCCNSGGFGWPESGLNVPIGPSADYSHGWIERIDPATGRVERLYEACDGLELAGPNDIVFDDQGGFWFTDLGKDVGTQQRHGGLYHAQADGSAIRRVAYGLELNGVGLSPDRRTVYGALTTARLILAFDAVSDAPATTGFGAIPYQQGRGLFAGRVAASFPGRRMLDSMAIEADGTIAQAVLFEQSGIARVDPASGAHVTLPFPDPVCTNIAFGGADMRDAYVTLSSSNRLVKTRWPAPGLRLAYNG